MQICVQRLNISPPTTVVRSAASLTFIRILAVLTPLLIHHTALALDFTHKIENGAATITGYTGPGGAVVVPAVIDGLRVGEIGDSAFQSKINITSVALPEGVAVIGQAAFANCSGLVSIALPKTLLTIRRLAFSNCASLRSIEIPDSATYMGDGLFQLCGSLSTAKLGNGVPRYFEWVGRQGRGSFPATK